MEENEFPKIDFVFPYVDSNDDNWFKTYKKMCIKYNRPIKTRTKENVRIRPWDTLQYVFRGIAKNVPWINKVYLLVEQESQVPKWLDVNNDKLVIVTHEEFIPKQFLPTYNSGVIEMFLSNIKGLSEYFIYSNDDMYILNALKPEDFFVKIDQDNKTTYLPKIRIRIKELKPKVTMYQKMLLNTFNMCLDNNDVKWPFVGKYLRSDHSINPILKSTMKMYLDKYTDRVYNSCTTFRTDKNMTQEISNYHHFLYRFKNDLLNDLSLSSKRKTHYTKIKDDTDFNILENEILNSETQILCINDSDILNFDKAKKSLVKIFDKKYPDKCEFEK